MKTTYSKTIPLAHRVSELFWWLLGQEDVEILWDGAVALTFISPQLFLVRTSHSEDVPNLLQRRFLIIHVSSWSGKTIHLIQDLYQVSLC